MRVFVVLTVLFACFALFAQSSVVAEVDGEKITVSDFRHGLSGQYSEMMHHRDMDDHMKREVLNELINRTLLYADAKTKNLANDPLYKEMMEAFQKKAMVEVYIQKHIYPTIEVTEDEITRVYRGNWAYFKPERMRVAMIMAREGDDISSQVAELRKFEISSADRNAEGAEDIYQKMQGAEFMINEVREDEYFVREIDGFWSARVGDFIGPKVVHGQQMAFKVLERIPEESVPMDEVRDDIVKRIKDRKLHDYIRRHAEELKKDATITIHNNVLRDL